MDVRTEVHDGLEFEVPTWDTQTGAWAKDPALEARVRSAILAAVPDFAEQVTAALETEPRDGVCWTFWGSHGCGLGADHPGLCVCTPTDPCSVLLKYGTSNTGILAWNGETEPSVHHWTWSH